MDYLKIIKDDLKINFNKTFIETWDLENCNCPFEIKPIDFLRFAKQDFNENTKRGLINSLTNSKRAIDCQIDTILYSCCIDFDNIPKASEEFIKLNNEDTNLPYKLQLISSLDFAPSGLISKVRTLRNVLEHYYKNPSTDDVKDALELAELFIRAVENKISKFYNGFILSDEENYFVDVNDYNRIIYTNAIRIKYSYEKKNIEVILIKNSKSKKLPIRINQNNSEFYFFLNILNNLNDEFDTLNSIKLFLKYINHPIPEKHVKVEIN